MGTVLRGGLLVGPDGSSRTVDLTVSGDRIAGLGEAAATGEHRVIDVGGMTFFPGLIDFHTHLTHYRFMEHDSAALAAFRAVLRGTEALRVGLTTVRDTGSFRALDLELRSAIVAGVVNGPRMVCAGGFLSMTGGHGHPRGVTADGETAVRVAAREQLRLGADFVKIMCSGGVLIPGTDTIVQYTEGEVRAAAEEAGARGKSLAAHAHPARAIQQAVLAGARFIEHGSFIDEEVAALMAARDVVLTPTFAVYSLTSDGGGNDDLREAARSILERKITAFRVALAAGVRWAVGSDSGTLTPVSSIVDEIAFLHRTIGIDVATVLDQATRGNARLLGFDDTGEFAIGARADLICLEGNPYEDLDALRQVRLTVAGGRVYDWRQDPVEPV
jgi:imidazolonepropionase-like amidohydrolase